MGPVAAVALPAVALAGSGARLWLVLALLVLLPLVLHWLWRATIPTYRTWSNRSSTIRAEIAGLKRQVRAVYNKYRVRQKGQQFKQVYSLAGRQVRELEEALSVGMFRERREVFVTAFMRNGVAVRVTASIGTPFRCSAADNPARWKEHVEKLGCDEIRQYHNHPDHNGRTVPSKTDIRSSGTLRRLLGAHAPKLRSLIICWNEVREWKVIEYDDAGRHALHFEYDAAS